jgi:hypothetical protein
LDAGQGTRNGKMRDKKLGIMDDRQETKDDRMRDKELGMI